MEEFLRHLEMDQKDMQEVYNEAYSLSQALGRKYKFGLPKNLQFSRSVLCVHLAFLKLKKKTNFPEKTAISQSRLQTESNYYTNLKLVRNLLNLESNISVTSIANHFNCVTCTVLAENLVNDYKTRINNRLAPEVRKRIVFGDDLPTAAYYLASKTLSKPPGLTKLCSFARVNRKDLNSKINELKKMFPERLISRQPKITKRMRRRSRRIVEKKENSAAIAEQVMQRIRKKSKKRVTCTNGIRKSKKMKKGRHSSDEEEQLLNEDSLDILLKAKGIPL